MQYFLLPFVTSLVAGLAVFFWGGVEALAMLFLLVILETTLSFDNAVVNAKVLGNMSELWQRRFITWGIPIAVFGTRLVLPILIVSAAAALSPFAVFTLALFEPVQYSAHLHDARIPIAAFGSAFLLLVSLKYFLNERKTVHWIGGIERVLTKWGGIEALEIALVLSVLMLVAFLDSTHAVSILVAGLMGIVLFIVIQGIAQSFEASAHGLFATGTGIALFAYLNVLDAAFSLDGVVAAFAITTSVPVIVAGLGVGALFVRAFTLMLVRAKTLDTLIYLEHGAHYAILGLSAAMLVGIFVEVPEVVTGFIGLLFVVLAYISSRREMSRHTPNLSGGSHTK